MMMMMLMLMLRAATNDPTSSRVKRQYIPYQPQCNTVGENRMSLRYRTVITHPKP